MNDDKTILKSFNKPIPPKVDADSTVLFKPEALIVNLLDIHGHIVSEYSVTGHFSAGRALDNTIVIDNHLISRHHLEVKWELGGWWIYNLKSTHGVFINGQLIEQKAKLVLPTIVKLGISPFFLEILDANQQNNQTRKSAELAHVNNDATQLPVKEEFTRPAIKEETIRSPIPKNDLSPEQIKKRLLQAEDSEDMGEHTIMVRRLIREDRVVRSKSYKKIIWVLAILFLIAAGLVTFQQFALSNARMIAINMFYDIKTLEVNLAQADVRLEENNQRLAQTMKEINGERFKVERDRIKLEQQKIAEDKIRLEQEKLKLITMQAKYQNYINEINFLRISFPTAAQYEKELITRVAKGFGESELELPDGFVDEVQKYIKYWQNSSRLQLAMHNLEQNNYAPIIFQELQKQGLPPYFIYLPLQESNFDTRAIGPETRFGIAKGAWQFLATTGQEYGLSAGPLANSPAFDEQDTRFDFNQATIAGAKYLKYIYSIQAQASGLLVMASYNYGHNKVKSMILEMPDNPRDKNFWKFIKQYQIPKETYDYVFYIFAAAVIGEDPKHFGFDFKPPLLYAGNTN